MELQLLENYFLWVCLPENLVLIQIQEMKSIFMKSAPTLTPFPPLIKRPFQARHLCAPDARGVTGHPGRPLPYIRADQRTDGLTE